jgi:hypothetical protein
MRKWILIGIVVLVVSSAIGYGVLQLQTSSTPSTASSPRPSGSGIRSDVLNSSPTPSTDVKPSNSPSEPVPSPRSSLSGPVLVAGGERAASNLESQSGCREDEPGKGFVDLRWSPATRRGQEQRIQVTIFREGFDTGNFKTSEVLTPERDSYQWTQPEGQARHYWRVLTRHSDGWIPSETARFEGPSCVAD